LKGKDELDNRYDIFYANFETRRTLSDISTLNVLLNDQGRYLLKGDPIGLIEAGLMPISESKKEYAIITH
jgi:hypothetical protein